MLVKSHVTKTTHVSGMAVDFKTSQPVEYYRKYLEQDVRPDGRELGEVRPTTLNIGSISTAEGSALVKLGNTTVVCGIKAEITTPKSEEPKYGIVVPNVELPPLCSPQFRPGPPSETAQIASFLVNQVIQKSQCINLEDLCIDDGKLVWVLYCDLMCLDHDGSLYDACVIALIAALKNLRLPTVTISEETGLPEVELDKKRSVPVSVLPVATTVGIFDERILLVDPTSEEETLCTGMVTIVTVGEDKLCMVHKPGGSSMSDQQLQSCITRAHQRAAKVSRLIDETQLPVER